MDDQPQPRSREEIDQLIEQWEKDPEWDLYEAEGFEFHREELLAHQEQKMGEWEKEYEAKKALKAASIRQGLYSMDLGERMVINEAYYTRVPGGWVFERLMKESGDWDKSGPVSVAISCVFIPYCDSFNPKI